MHDGCVQFDGGVTVCDEFEELVLLSDFFKSVTCEVYFVADGFVCHGVLPRI